MLIEFEITIHYEGKKTFRIGAGDFEEALKIARRGPEHITNEIRDTVNESIIKIERIEEKNNVTRNTD